jgi:1,4-dihydroxy-2-naphthoate octaprenyltransferase
MRLARNILKAILDFIVYSNLFISVGVALFTFQVSFFFDMTALDTIPFVIINFTATFVMYNLQRLYYSSQQPESAKYIWYQKNKRLLFTLMVLLLVLMFKFIFYFLLENLSILFSYLGLSLLSILYFLPPFQLKKYGLLKPFLIGFVFVATCIVLPIFFSKTGYFSPAGFLYMLGQFCFISALCVLFDVRDVTADREKNIVTWPIKFGLKRAKIVCIILFVIYLSQILIAPQNTAISISFIFILGIVVAFFSSLKRHNYYYLFLVDGLIIVQFAFFNYLS